LLTVFCLVSPAEATSISGNLSGNLSISGSPYQATADITVPSGQSLSIDPGVIIEMSPGTNFIIIGTLVAAGTPANPIIISSLQEGTTQAAPGQWGSLQFNNSTSATELTNVIIRFGQQTALSNAYPQWNGITISSMSGTAVSSDFASLPTGSGNQAFGCSLNAVYRPGGTITTPITWAGLGIPYVITSSIIDVGPGGRLTLPAGVVVKLLSTAQPSYPWNDYPAYFNVHDGGELVTQGAPDNPVVLTSLKDDSVAGDSNGDGGATAPKGTDWSGIQFTQAGPGSQLINTIVRYAGFSGNYGAFSAAVGVSSSLLTVTGCTIRDSAKQGLLAAQATQVKVDQTQFLNNGKEALSLAGGSTATVTNSQFTSNSTGLSLSGDSVASVDHNSFTTNTGYGVTALQLNGSLTVTNSVFSGNLSGWMNISPSIPLNLSGDSGVGNTLNRIDVAAGSITRPVVWPAFLGMAYTVNSSIIDVGTGGRLTLAAGVVVKLLSTTTCGPQFCWDNPAYFNVHDGGELVTQGAPDNPVVLTSLKDDSVAGDTNGDGNASTPTIHDWSGIQFNLAGPGSRLVNTVVRYGGFKGYNGYTGNAVSVSSSSLIVTGCTIRDNTSGIYVDGSAVCTIHNSNLLNNPNYGVLENNPSMTTDARYNYWGSTTGPTNSANPGTGDAVVGSVNYIPFLISPWTGSSPSTGSISISPTHGGNTGPVTVTVTVSSISNGFVVGDTVTLTCNQQQIMGSTPTITTNSLTTTFNLTGATPGQCNVVITQPGGTTVTVPLPFTIDQGGAPNVWMNVVGFANLRAGRPQEYFILYGNRGDVDAFFTPVTLQVSNVLTVGWTNMISTPTVPSGVSVDWSQISPEIAIATNTVISLLLPRINAGTTGDLPFSLSAPDLHQYAHLPVPLTAWVSKPCVFGSQPASMAQTVISTTTYTLPSWFNPQCASSLAAVPLTQGLSDLCRLRVAQAVAAKMKSDLSAGVSLTNTAYSWSQYIEAAIKSSSITGCGL